MSAFHRWLLFYAVYCLVLVVAATVLAPLAMGAGLDDVIAPASNSVLDSSPRSDGSVDFAPVLEWLIGAFGAVLLAVVGWVGRAISIYFNVKSDSEYRAYVEKALSRAIEYAQVRAADYARTNSKVPVRSELLEIALDYAVAAVPEGLKRLKLDAAKVRQLIDARLPVDTSGPRR
jgi:ABC-type multidrug transport system fused ATPase/permease subunit